MSGVPKGVTSGRAIAQLKESDQQEYKALLVQEAENKKILYTAWLKLIQSKYTEERLLKVAGEEKMPEIISFEGADLKNNTDVWIDDSDFMAQTRSGRQAQAMDFYESGILGPKDDNETRRRAIGMLQTGKLDDMWEESGDDFKQARWENKEMAKGEVLPKVEEWEYHEVHEKVHRKPLISPLSKKENPKIRQNRINHLLEHQKFTVPPAVPPGQGSPAGAGAPAGQPKLPVAGGV